MFVLMTNFSDVNPLKLTPQRKVTLILVNAWKSIELLELMTNFCNVNPCKFMQILATENYVISRKSTQIYVNAQKIHVNSCKSGKTT